jgi:hypothetical protein
MQQLKLTVDERITGGSIAVVGVFLAVAFVLTKRRGWIWNLSAS